MLSGHMVQWRLELAPIDLLDSHPSNTTACQLVKALYSPAATADITLRNLLAQQPDYIVRPKTVEYFDERPPLSAIFEAELAANYTLLAQKEDLQIFHAQLSD